MNSSSRSPLPQPTPSSLPPAAATRAGVVSICAAIALLSLWLRTGFPLVAIGPSSLDDALFLRLADSLLSGQWLGAYDNATLAKGMFYPFFIALSFLAGIPLKVAEQAAYLGVCGWLAVFVARRAGNACLGVVLFALLALNPVMWLAFMARVVREGIYVSLSLLLLGASVAALFPAGAATPRRRLLTSACAGLVCACFWLTREEGPWILPSLATAVGVFALCAYRADRAWPGQWRDHGLALLRAIAPALLVFLLGLGVVKAMNQVHYGVFETNEFHASSFQRGYGALARIKHAKWQRHVVFPADARAKAYAQSSAARELAPFLDGESGERWRAIGCEQTGTAPCPEILSGWFMWALRDAVAQAGHYRSAPEALQFYERLADEINAACDAGRLDCLAPRSTLAPPFRWEFLHDMWLPARTLVPFVFRMGEGAVASAASSGSPQQLALFAGLTGDRLSPAPVPAVVSGWAATRGALQELALVDTQGRPVTALIEYAAAPDVARLFPTLSAVRFKVRSECVPGACSLRVRTATATETVPLRVGSGPAAEGLKLFIDALEEAPPPPVVSRREDLQRAMARPIARAYMLAFPPLTVVAAVGILLALVQPAWRRRHGALLALASACGVAVVVRIALLAYLDVTSIPSANGSYATPVSPMLVVFVALGSWLAWCQARDGLRALARKAAGQLPSGGEVP